MSDERRLEHQTELRHDLWHKVRRGFRLWRSGQLNLRRIVNAGLCHLSLRRRFSRVLGKPFFLMIEPTNACNLRCPLCPTGRGTLGRKTAFLPLDLFKKCIDEIGRYLIEVNVSNYGEPMLHKDLPEMIAYAKAAGPRVAIGCNAHFLSEENARRLVDSGLDSVYVSFDGVDQQTYEAYRVRGDFAKVCDGVRTLLEQRRSLGRTSPYVELQFLVMKHNEHQLDAFRALADELGADGRIIKPVTFNVADWDDPGTLETYGRFIPENDEFRLYRHDGARWRWKNEELAFCTAPWRSITVLCDGSIVPCCRDPRGRYTFGNVADGVLRVWNNKPFRNFRRRIIRHRDALPICSVCPGE